MATLTMLVSRAMRNAPKNKHVITIPRRHEERYPEEEEEDKAVVVVVGTDVSTSSAIINLIADT